MKKSELFDLSSGLQSCGNLKGVKFAYAIAKNANIVKKEIELFKMSLGPSDRMQEYEKKRIELAVEHAEKDKSNEPVVKEGRYVLKDQAVFDVAIKELREEYMDAIKEQEEKNKEYQEMMKEEIEVTLFKIDQSLIPEEINASQMTSILPIINN